jgi:hypothetical protein
MSHKLIYHLIAALIFVLPVRHFAQAPDLGTAANFVLFSSDGAVSHTGISQITGNVGTNNGSSTGFGNVNGSMHDADGVSAQCAADLLIAYGQLFNAIPTFFPAPLLGNGQVLVPGIYSVFGGATLNGELILDGQHQSEAVFILQIEGAFSTAAQSRVTLINGAQACQVYWKVEGLVDMATQTDMVGNIVANNAAIILNAGTNLEGRALSTTGAVTVHTIYAQIPPGCGRPLLQGPAAPVLGEAGCYGIFSGDGPVQNTGITHIKGDVGTNVGLTTGFDPLTVSGEIHPIPDVSTAQAAEDLLPAYNYLNGLAHDIELLYPAQFGAGLVLTPHTYLLNAATSLTDVLYLNAEGNQSAVFVIKIYGALTTSTYANVILMNGASADNVYWLINGAVTISDYTLFKGTIISQGAVNLYTGMTLEGRALTGVGALETAAITGSALIDPGICGTTAFDAMDKERSLSVMILPNPAIGSFTVLALDATGDYPLEWRLYDQSGRLVSQLALSGSATTIDTGHFPAGFYFYRVTGGRNYVHSGKLVVAAQ